MIKLKPCPCCAGNIEIAKRTNYAGPDTYHISCIDCGVGCSSDNYNKLVKIWNKRKTKGNQ